MITIMIIDDNKSFRWITKKVLIKEHFNVIEASSKSEALTLLKESKKSSLSTEKIVEDLAWKRINT